MRTICLVSRKGGAQKSTLCMGLAVVAESRGAGPVALIDTDPQATLSKWWERRKADTPILVKPDLDHLGTALRQLAAQGTALTVIDTPGFYGSHTQAVIAACDLVIIPVQPTMLDIEQVADTIDIVERAKRPMVFVVTGATVRASVTASAVRALSQHGTVAPVTIHRRLDVPAAAPSGQTITETAPSSKSAAEIAELWDYVQTRLNKQRAAAA